MRKWFLLCCLVMSLPLFSASSIPVLDMRDYHNPQTRNRFIRQLKNAAEEVGFFALLHFGIEDALLKTAYQGSEAFFRLDIDTKMKYCIRELAGQRGYVPGESAKGEMRPDYKEFFTVGREITDCNVWPKEVNLEKPLLRLFSEIEKCKGPLEAAFSEALGQSRGFFGQKTRRGESILRLFHYPRKPPSGCFWAAPHTDINLFTIFLRATAKGLQLKTKEGEWIEVIVPEKAVVIGCGDMMENLTNGLFRSAVHRVCDSERGIERFGMAFYTHGGYQDRMDPLDICVGMTGGKPKYAEATARELLSERLVDLGLATPEVMQQLASSGLMQRLMKMGRASPQAVTALKKAGLLDEYEQ